MKEPAFFVGRLISSRGNHTILTRTKQNLDAGIEQFGLNSSYPHRGEAKEPEKYFALNDAVIERGQNPQLISLLHLLRNGSNSAIAPKHTV
jgi:NAD kinase